MNAIQLSCYRATRARLRACLSQTAKWREAPALLDELDALRRSRPDLGSGAAAPDRIPESVWVGRFTATLRPLGRPVDTERMQAVAGALWRWFGHLDPEPIARGAWDDMPRSHA